MMNLDDPVANALKVASVLERDEIAYGLYGDLAVAAWGVPWETKDADLAVVSCGPRNSATMESLQDAGVTGSARHRSVA